MINGSLDESVKFESIMCYHGERLPSVKAARDIRMVDERNQLIVRTTLEVSIALSQVDIDLDGVLDGGHRVVVFLN